MYTKLLSLLTLLIASHSFGMSVCDEESDLGQLQKSFTELINEIGCNDLPIGQTIPVLRTGLDSDLGATAKYLLTHTDRKSFEIGLRVKFEGSNPDQEAQMMAKTQACLASVDGRLTAPDGHSLQLKLLSAAASKNLGIPVTSIFIDESPNSRSNSHRYSANIDCPSIIHELLHLVGLVDEYDETDPKSVGGDYSCRAPGKPDSIMRNPWCAFQANESSSTVLAKMCSCPDIRSCSRIESDSECKDAGFQIRTQQFEVPNDLFDKGESAVLKFINPFDVSSASRGFGMGYFAGKVIQLHRTSVNQKPPGSLLYPAHFRRITQPFCASANDIYDRCARFSLVSTVVYLGSQVLNAGPCPPLPKECLNGDWLQ